MFHTNAAASVLYCARQRWQFFVSRPDRVLSLDLPAAVQRDLEILNHDELISILLGFIKQSGIQPGAVVVVISPELVFEADFAFAPEEKQNEMESQFLETIPFETILTIRLPLTKGYRLLAINKEFVSAVRSAVEKSGFSVAGFVFGQYLGALAGKRWLDVEMGKYVLKNWNQLLMEKVDEKPPAEHKPTSGPRPTPGSSKIRQYILLAILGLLLIVLFVVAYTQGLLG